MCVCARVKFQARAAARQHINILVTLLQHAYIMQRISVVGHNGRLTAMTVTSFICMHSVQNAVKFCCSDLIVIDSVFVCSGYIRIE